MEETKNKETEWLAQSLRFTGFLLPNVAPSPIPSWEQIVGAVPESSVSRSGIGLQQEEGPFGPGRLGLVRLPGRIDWLLNAAAQPDVETIQSLGNLEEALGTLRPILLKWFETSPEVSRVALGAILLQPVESVPEGYRRLAKYLEHTIHLDPEGSSDFGYSINRPRASKTASMEMMLNRLSKWSVSANQTVQINVGEKTAPATMVQLQYSCRLELDLSTPATFQHELPKTQLIDIFDEFVVLAQEIARFGDIP
jgi:hypothetical protein